MVKNDIVSALHKNGYYKEEANKVVNDVFQIIRDALSHGEQVQIRGFGTFGIKTHKGRNSLDISTGKKRVFDDCLVPMFKASDNLKEAVRASISADK